MGKVILITGASSGIGKSVGEYLHNKGFVVYGSSRNPEKIKATIPMLPIDVRDNNSIKKAVDIVIKKHGKIDVLINNAGVGITGPLEEMPLEEIQNNFHTNVFGPIEMIKAVLPYMRKEKKGLIINITSIAGYMGLPFRSVYSSSKGALELITEALRMEVKSFGIEVTNVAPGDFATDIALRRYHTPLYKDSPYSTVYRQQLDIMNKDVNAGQNPIEMAKAIHKIINTPKPKVRYKVGSFLQKISIILKFILPSKMYEKMLMNHYKL